LGFPPDEEISHGDAERKPAFGERSLFAYPPNKHKFVWGDKTVVKMKKARNSTLMFFYGACLVDNELHFYNRRIVARKL
jgi:hypothetical protein